MGKQMKNNLVKNWDMGYDTLEVTYEDQIINDRTSFIMNMGYERIFETISSKIDVSKSFKTLECGCGGARASVYLAKHGADVTCIDTSTEALRLAKNNLSSQNVVGSLLKTDIYQLPFDDNSFDVVMSFGLIEHFVDINRPFEEMTRVLRKGGVSIHTIIPKKISLWSVAHVWNFAFKVLVHLRDRKLRGIIKNSRRNFPHFENNYSKKQYLSSMKQAGLSECYMTGTGLWAPFIFPKKWEPRVLELALKNKDWLKRFDRSRSRITDILGPTYFSVGQKL